MYYSATRNTFLAFLLVYINQVHWFTLHYK